jgi:uroporphyrinogen-III synthase
MLNIVVLNTRSLSQQNTLNEFFEKNKITYISNPLIEENTFLLSEKNKQIIQKSDNLILTSKNSFKSIIENNLLPLKNNIYCIGSGLFEYIKYNSHQNVINLGKDVFDLINNIKNYNIKNACYLRGEEISVDIKHELKNIINIEEIICYKIKQLSKINDSIFNYKKIIIPILSKNTAIHFVKNILGIIKKNNPKIFIICFSEQIQNIIKENHNMVLKCNYPTIDSLLECILQCYKKENV